MRLSEELARILPAAGPERPMPYGAPAEVVSDAAERHADHPATAGKRVRTAVAPSEEA